MAILRQLEKFNEKKDTKFTISLQEQQRRRQTPVICEISGANIILNPNMSKITMRFILVALVVLLSSLTFCQAFGSARKPKKIDTRPSFDADKNLYIRNPNDDGVLPYDPIGSLLRQGPAPCWTRLTNGNEYEQGILKYMFNAKVERDEACGNIDAKLNNVMDWNYQKRAELNGAPKVDYNRLDQKQAYLVSAWAFGITPLVISIAQKTFHLGTPLLPFV